ncbi:ly6/PLAUR domain-containing protein 3 [Phalacrocorax carbo]|uniref:ly6/PLAUR domain-containing protein 3 n=1 Tax=Phalacrocorax carbo TaxID=9209 RepID=UPI00311A1A6D
MRRRGGAAVPGLRGAGRDLPRDHERHVRPRERRLRGGAGGRGLEPRALRDWLAGLWAGPGGRQRARPRALRPRRLRQEAPVPGGEGLQRGPAPRAGGGPARGRQRQRPGAQWGGLLRLPRRRALLLPHRRQCYDDLRGCFHGNVTLRRGGVTLWHEVRSCVRNESCSQEWRGDEAVGLSGSCCAGSLCNGPPPNKTFFAPDLPRLELLPHGHAPTAAPNATKMAAGTAAPNGSGSRAKMAATQGKMAATEGKMAATQSNMAANTGQDGHHPVQDGHH